MLLKKPNPPRLPLARSPILSAALAAMLGLAFSSGDAVAQTTQEALPSREALELSSALSRLSRDPRNVDALTDAGIAASKLGDFEAAVGFFKRGQALAPTNPRLSTSSSLDIGRIRNACPYQSA